MVKVKVTVKVMVKVKVKGEDGVLQDWAPLPVYCLFNSHVLFVCILANR